MINFIILLQTKMEQYNLIVWQLLQFSSSSGAAAVHSRTYVYLIVLLFRYFLCIYASEIWWCIIRCVRDDLELIMWFFEKRIGESI